MTPQNDVSMFPEALKVSTVPHFEILGAPIGDYIYCASFVSTKRSEALKLLLKLEDVAIKDPQVALLLLRMCGSFSKLVHLARLHQQHLFLRPFSSSTLMLSIVFHHA